MCMCANTFKCIVSHEHIIEPKQNQKPNSFHFFLATQWKQALAFNIFDFWAKESFPTLSDETILTYASFGNGSSRSPLTWPDLGARPVAALFASSPFSTFSPVFLFRVARLFDDHPRPPPPPLLLLLLLLRPLPSSCSFPFLPGRPGLFSVQPTEIIYYIY